MTHDDRELRTWFEALRERERRAAPSFEAVLRRPRPRVSWKLAAAAALLLIVAVLAVVRPRPLPIEQLTAWRSPTQSLLEVPESPLLTTTPSITR